MEEKKKSNGRKHVEVPCTQCGTLVSREIHHLYSKTFCSKECFSTFCTTGKLYKCEFCGTSVFKTTSAAKRTKSGRVFCNRSCATSYNNKFKARDKHPNWNGGRYRDNALIHYGVKCSCSDCELTNLGVKIPEKMLDVHHIDGDRKNNKIENLEVLCVWCHAKKTRQNW